MKWLAPLVLLLVMATAAHARPYLVGTRYGMTASDLGLIGTKLQSIDVWKVELDEWMAEWLVAVSPFVEFVEVDEVNLPDKKPKPAPAVVPNDPRYAEQWYHPTINAPNAWDVTRGSSSVVVAVVDSGIDDDHEDFAGQLVAGWNVRDDNADTDDQSGHGTRCAGMVAAATNNAIGIASIGWRTRLMPIRAAEPEGFAFTSNLADGITEAANRGARVVSVSFGSRPDSPTINAAAQYAMSKGTITVYSAGNCGCVSEFPDTPWIIHVGATTRDDVIASFSSQGEYVDLSAPGSSVLSTIHTGGYASVSGTSFSAPLVAGVTALMIAVRPTASTSEVIANLLSTTTDKGTPGRDPVYGHGRVNAAKAVKAMVQPSPTRTPTRVTTRTPTRTPTRLTTPTRTPTRVITPTRTPTPRPTPTPTRRPCRLVLLGICIP